MAILFDSTKLVKPPVNRDFGRGLVRALPAYRDMVSAADRGWAAEHMNANADDFEPLTAAEAERRALESDWLAAYEAGNAGY